MAARWPQVCDEITIYIKYTCQELGKFKAVSGNLCIKYNNFLFYANSIENWFVIESFLIDPNIYLIHLMSTRLLFYCEIL